MDLQRQTQRFTTIEMQTNASSGSHRLVRRTAAVLLSMTLCFFALNMPQPSTVLIRCADIVILTAGHGLSIWLMVTGRRRRGECEGIPTGS